MPSTSFDLGVLVVCEIDVKKFFFFDSSFTKVVFPAPRNPDNTVTGNLPFFFSDFSKVLAGTNDSI